MQDCCWTFFFPFFSIFTRFFLQCENHLNENHLVWNKTAAYHSQDAELILNGWSAHNKCVQFVLTISSLGRVFSASFWWCFLLCFFPPFLVLSCACSPHLARREKRRQKSESIHSECFYLCVRAYELPPQQPLCKISINTFRISVQYFRKFDCRSFEAVHNFMAISVHGKDSFKIYPTACNSDDTRCFYIRKWSSSDHSSTCFMLLSAIHQ